MIGSGILGEVLLGGEEEASGVNLLAATQADDTLVATGSVTGAGSGGATLSAAQASNTLSASGTVVSGGPTIVRLVAILNGPAGYIKEVDANGLTDVDIRFNGFITLPQFSPNGVAGDKLRYYVDPASEAGALLAENVDTSWDMDLHRGNGFINLGLFSVLDPPIGGGTISGSVTATQASQTIASNVDVLVKGTLAAAQASQTVLSVGGEPNAWITGTMFVSQADDSMIGGVAKAIGRGSVTVAQASNVASIVGTSVLIVGTIIADVDVGPRLDALVDIDGYLAGDVLLGPVLEGEVL